MSAVAAGARRAPTSRGEELRRFVALTLTLAVSEYKLRFFGSVLGYLWTLVRPLLFFGVLYFVFSEIARFGSGIDHYPVYLLCSIVLWTFFAEATNSGVASLVARENLLRKMRFPRLVVPVSTALTSLFLLLGNLVAVAVFVAASGLRPRLTWLQVPLIVLAFFVLATGLCMLLSALYVRFRDVQPIWEVTVQILFYASPILFVAGQYDRFGETFKQVAMCSPIAALLTQMRHALIDPSAPTAAQELGGTVWLLVPTGIVVGLFALGFWVFRREAPRIAENL